MWELSAWKCCDKTSDDFCSLGSDFVVFVFRHFVPGCTIRSSVLSPILPFGDLQPLGSETAFLMSRLLFLGLLEPCRCIPPLEPPVCFRTLHFRGRENNQRIFPNYYCPCVGRFFIDER